MINPYSFQGNRHRSVLVHQITKRLMQRCSRAPEEGREETVIVPKWKVKRLNNRERYMRSIPKLELTAHRPVIFIPITKATQNWPQSFDVQLSKNGVFI